MIKSLANFLLFQIAWFAAISGGAKGWPLLGSIPALIVVAIHLGLNGDHFKREVFVREPLSKGS